MATQGENEKVQALLADLRNAIVDQNPELAEAVDQYIDQMFRTVADEESGAAPDAGFSRLIGFGPDAARYLNQTRIPSRVEEYDETVTAERINAVGDLYYIFQHEKLGVFRVMQKLKELFEAGTLRLSSGDGAFWLYQFDKRGVLRYTRRDRFAAYRRVLGYGSAPVAAGAVPNTDFHRLMTHFVNEVVQFWRDKRISDVIRTGADDPSFGSIATVRRAGLDLRNNLKWASYGHVNVLRVEVMQLLDEAFRILNAPDMRQQFGADNAWDVIEEVLSRYFNEQPNSSSRQ